MMIILSPPCYDSATIDAWAIRLWASGRPECATLSRHIAGCPGCLRRAAEAWSLLADPAGVVNEIPSPNLDFLGGYLE